MIIIIDGPEGSGKTTMARRLSDDLSIPYVHNGHIEGIDLVQHLQRLVLDYEDAIFDRFVLSAVIYGKIVRGHDPIGADNLFFIRYLSHMRGAKEVICLPPPENCHAAWVPRRANKVHQDDATFFRVWSEYAYMANRLRIPIHDWTHQSYEEVRGELIT